MTTPSIRVRPDAKGRVGLGKLAKGVSSYRVIPKPGGAVLLEPMVEIPAREVWLFENQEAHASVKRGLRQSAEGQTRSRGSFAKHVNDEE